MSVIGMNSVDQKFCQLRDTWRTETAHLSSVERCCMHPAYQKIIGMGPTVVPLLLLRELELAPDHWFWALSAITREDPIPEEQHGNVRAMAATWVQWAANMGILSYV